MTFKEWMEKNKPEYVDERCIAGVDGCPYEYDLETEEESEKNCDTTKKGWECCERCWNREMPEESSIEKSLEYFKNRLSKILGGKRREAYLDAVRALEKQLANKPENVVDYYSFTIGEYRIGKCPNCGSEVSDVLDVCLDCEYNSAWFCKHPKCKSIVLTSIMLGARPSGCPKIEAWNRRAEE